MRRKIVLTLVAKTYCNWLLSQLPPSGKPKVPLLLAYITQLIEILPQGEGPENVGSAGSMTEENLRTSLEWIWFTLSESYTQNDWAQIAVHALRLQALPHANEILDMILRPSTTLDSKEQPALPSKHTKSRESNPEGEADLFP